MNRIDYSSIQGLICITVPRDGAKDRVVKAYKRSSDCTRTWLKPSISLASVKGE